MPDAITLSIGVSSSPFQSMSVTLPMKGIVGDVTTNAERCVDADVERPARIREGVRLHLREGRRLRVRTDHAVELHVEPCAHADLGLGLEDHLRVVGREVEVLDRDRRDVGAVLRRERYRALQLDEPVRTDRESRARAASTFAVMSTLGMKTSGPIGIGASGIDDELERLLVGEGRRSVERDVRLHVRVGLEAELHLGEELRR